MSMLTEASSRFGSSGRASLLHCCAVCLIWLAVFRASAVDPEEVCAGCPIHSCCCMSCGLHGTGDVNFSCKTRSACAKVGGQCKSSATSAYSRGLPSKQAPLSAFVAPEAVEQVHIIGGSPDRVSIVFLTTGFSSPAVELRSVSSRGSLVWNASGKSRSYSTMLFPAGIDGIPEHTPTPGHSMAYCKPGAYQIPSCFYSSPQIHTVDVKGLDAGATYEYRPLTSTSWRKFRTAPAVGQPITFGVLADVGRTSDALRTMQHLSKFVTSGTINAILLAGDLAYADGYAPAWDQWGQMSEFLLESVPTAFAIGNHEVASGMENFVNFEPRYGWPDQSRSGSALWYSFEAGLTHVITLCSYCDYAPDSLQRRWLEQDLQGVDRARTPWVVVMMHVPFYSSNMHHNSSESAAMKASMEDMMYKYKVDVIISGHVHAYERTAPVYKNNVVCDGPMQIVVGDGGNKEGPACPWSIEAPAWTRLREFSFGHGQFSFVNSTHARWIWHRNQDGEAKVADDVWIQTSRSRCRKQDEVAEIVV